MWPWLRGANLSDNLLSFHFNIWESLWSPLLPDPLMLPWLHFISNVAAQELKNEPVINKIATEVSVFFFGHDDESPELDAFLSLVDLFITTNWCQYAPVFELNMISLCQRIESYSIATSTRLLNLFEKMTDDCSLEYGAILSSGLDVGVIMKFIESSDRNLVHSALIALSVMIRTAIVDSTPLVKSPLMRSVLNKMSEADFKERRVAVRLFESILVDQPWTVFPVDAFRTFMTAALDFVGNSSRETESILIGLLTAIHSPNREFQKHAYKVCHELEIFNEIPPLSMVGGRVGALATRILTILHDQTVIGFVI
jgi:hypothetical protein